MHKTLASPGTAALVLALLSPIALVSQTPTSEEIAEMTSTLDGYRNGSK